MSDCVLVAAGWYGRSRVSSELVVTRTAVQTEVDITDYIEENNGKYIYISFFSC